MIFTHSKREGTIKNENILTMQPLFIILHTFVVTFAEIYEIVVLGGLFAM